MRKTFYRVQFSNALPSRDFQSKTKAIKYAKNKTAGHTFVAHIFKWDMDGNYDLLYTI